MKKLWRQRVIMISVLLCSAAYVFAQEQQARGENWLNAKFGIKAGLNLSNMFVDDISDENMKVGWQAGFFAKVPIVRYVSIQPELLYSLKGAKQNYNNFLGGEGEYRFNLHYIELPVLAVFNIGSNFNIHAGGYVAYLAEVNITDLDDDGTITEIADLDADDFNQIDYGLAGGLGVDIERFTIGARYTYGLREIGNDGNFSGEVTRDSRNSVISLYIGFGF